MATAKPNILINSISGRLGSVVFYTRRGKLCVRSYVIPRNPDTEAQRVVRRSFAGAVLSWQSMTDEERYTYKRKARFMNMSGYNLYISLYMKTNYSDKSAVLKLTAASGLAASAAFISRLPSVSKSYIKASSANLYPKQLKPDPG